MIPKTEDEHLEKGGSQASFVAMSVPASMYQTSTRQYISVTQRPIHIGHAMSDGMTGLPNSGTQQPGPRLVPYAPTIVDGTQQFFMPSQIIVNEEKSSLSLPLRHANLPDTQFQLLHWPQGNRSSCSPPITCIMLIKPRDSTRKRELRLMKNREAAKECRRRKKEYIKCLESRVAMLEVQNKNLLEELKILKQMCRVKVELNNAT
ncbi:cAMP-responsive element modulator [Bombina bombina]|uniref:cAMP-responsive element modulator n=1 Tax=Bombina bombina TaxID=8345 RepID=UPI00235AF23E|nr:cAMP-responsive element modulator [Bombina bombina]